MHTIPNNMAEPVTRLMIEQPQLFAFLYDSGIYLIEDDEDNPTAKTDGKRWIRVNPVFMKKCYNGEEGSPGADIFVLAHEIMHCALMHGEWLASVHEHGFTLNEALVNEIRKFNPSTRWRAGMVIPAELAPHLIQWALDYVINALLWEWGMKITPYVALRDPAIALWTDAEDTAFCRLIGRELIEPPGQGGGNPGSSRAAQGPATPGNQPGETRPGAGGEDMVASYQDDLPEEAGSAPYDQQRRKMGVETMLKEIAQEMKAQGRDPLGMDRIIDRLIPSNVKWRQNVTMEWKAASGRGMTSWNRLAYKSMAMGIALPGQVGKRAGVVVTVRDTSGSQGQLELNQMGGCCLEVLKQVQPRRMILLDVDAAIQQVQEPKTPAELYRMLTDLGFKGGGGTDMRKAFEWCKEKGINPDTIIILTDGYTPWPEDHAPAKRALWVITTPGITAPEACGQSIYMPLDHLC